MIDGVGTLAVRLLVVVTLVYPARAAVTWTEISAPMSELVSRYVALVAPPIGLPLDSH